MRLYFLLGAVATLLLCLALLALLMRRLRINWNQNNRMAWAYLMPVLLAGLFLYISVTQFAPRVFDAIDILNRQYELKEAEIDTSALSGNCLEIEGEVYLFPPYKRFLFRESGQYQVYFTRRTRHVMNLVFVGESASSAPEAEPSGTP